MAEAEAAIRAVHLLAMATVVGGALCAALLATAAAPRRLLAFERIAWGGLGLLVLTGIGNAGARGSGWPGPGTLAGNIVTAKLILVAVLLTASCVRTFAVVRLTHMPPGPHAWRRLHGWYAATAAIAAAIALLGVALAHAV